MDIKVHPADFLEGKTGFWCKKNETENAWVALPWTCPHCIAVITLGTEDEVVAHVKSGVHLRSVFEKLKDDPEMGWLVSADIDVKDGAVSIQVPREN